MRVLFRSRPSYFGDDVVIECYDREWYHYWIIGIARSDRKLVVCWVIEVIDMLKIHPVEMDILISRLIFNDILKESIISRVSLETHIYQTSNVHNNIRRNDIIPKCCFKQL